MLHSIGQQCTLHAYCVGTWVHILSPLIFYLVHAPPSLGRARALSFSLSLSLSHLLNFYVEFDMKTADLFFSRIKRKGKEK